MSPADPLKLTCWKHKPKGQRMSVSVCKFKACDHLRHGGPWSDGDGEFYCVYRTPDRKRLDKRK